MTNLLLLLSLAGITLIALIAWFIGLTLREVRDDIEHADAILTAMRSEQEWEQGQLQKCARSLNNIQSTLCLKPSEEQLKKIVELYKLWFQSESQEPCFDYIRKRL